MELENFKIINIFSELNIYNKKNEKITTIYNDFCYSENIPNFIYSGDKTSNVRTEKQKWNEYKNKKIIEIKNADLDLNWENNYVDIIIDI